MSYLDDYLDTYDNEFDDDDFEDYEDEQNFYAYDYPFHPDLAQRDRDRHDRDHGDRRRRRVRCCIYRHRRSGRIRKVCQSRDRRCSNRLGREWTLIDSFSARNCNRCL